MPSVTNVLKDAIVEWQKNGWKVQYKGHSTAVLITDTQEFNHVPYMIMTLCSFFILSPVWLIAALAAHPKQKRVQLTITQNGSVDWKWV